jgi:AcrR family transcriptional regulator
LSGERRRFRREGEERRRDQLIAAALEIIAEDGLEAATVRAIAARAGVTQGLIRHYFSSKEELTRAAYHTHMTRMTEANFAALADAPADPVARLSAFVAASLRPPVTDAAAMGLWSAFLQMVRRDRSMAGVHEATYLAYRDRLESLIAALPGQGDPKRLRRLAIACNGIIDGLWLEGSAYPEGFAPDELAEIGVMAVGAVLGLDLSGHMPPAAQEQKDDT